VPQGGRTDENHQHPRGEGLWTRAPGWGERILGAAFGYNPGVSPGRSNKPLFEVLSEHPPKGPLSTKPRRAPEPDAAPDATPKAPPTSPPTSEPSIRPDPRRAPAQAEPKPVRRVVPTPMPEPREGTSDEPAQAGAARPVVTIPLSTVYTAISLGVVLVLLAWIGGYKVGYAGAESDLIAGSEQDRPNVVNEPDPELTAPFQLPNQIQPETTLSGVTPEGTGQPAQGTDPTPQTTPPATPQGSPNGTILSARGLLEIDPREVGLNYLELGTFSREMTQDAIDFMGASGQEAIGVPQGGGRYRLISVGLGVPGNRFGEMQSQRVAHKNAIAEIGARWARDRQGGSDFAQSKTQWYKYQP